MSLNPEYLTQIKTLPSLIRYLRDELDWPIETDDFEELTFDYEPKELGIDTKTAAKIEEIKQLRPLVTNQPWAIFFVKFEPKRLPVIALRRILSRLVIKKKASARKSDLASWSLNDLLFISNYGEGNQRHITFAHFSQDDQMGDLPTLKVLGWDDEDTVLHLEQAHKVLKEKLRWPSDPQKVDEWREQWASIFTLRHKEVITTSKDLAIQLAHLATAIRKRVSTILSIESENGPLKKLMNAFKQSLIHDLYEEAFADMYAQTITYGLLSARVSRPAGLVADNLTDMVPITNPFLKELLSTFLTLGGRKGKIDFDELGINEVVHALRNANMEAVLRDFGDKNPQEDPVIHFYELFLREYNPKLRMQRGVFYTPRPVVSFIVRSVDEILRREFGLEDGLADTTTWGEMLKRFSEMKIPQGTKPDEPFVQILDPALGTGTFLVEVIDVIHKTMTNKWEKAGHPTRSQQQLWNDYVPKHLLPRLYGFELLMAPYAIAHMKIGLKLWEAGYRFGSNERAHIFLTNSLEPPQDFSDTFAQMAPTLAHEAQAVNIIKRNKRFTVIIGNPPYSNYGQLNKNPFILELLEDYKRGLNEKKLNLDDDFIKFIRLSQSLIESAGYGILGFITNNTYLDGITHRQMRNNIWSAMSTLRILDLHGSAAKKERCPDGSKDENIFDIQQGVGISLWNRTPGKHERGTVLHADLWGLQNDKYEWLIKHSISSTQVGDINPCPPYFFFVRKDFDLAHEYMALTPLVNVCSRYITGIDTKIDYILIDEDKIALQDKMATLLDPGISISEVKQLFGIPKTSTWEIKRAKTATFDRTKVVQVLYRPFDIRYTYYDDKVLSRARPSVMNHFVAGKNLGLCFMRQYSYNCDYCYFLVTKVIVESRIFVSNRGRAQVLPLYLYRDKKNEPIEQMFQSLPPKKEGSDVKIPNISAESIEFLSCKLGLRFVANDKGDLRATFGPEDVLHYIYSVFHSNTYRSRYAEFLKIDFPRLPLTSSLELFRDSPG